MRWHPPAWVLIAAVLTALPAHAQDDQGCRDWRVDPARAVEGCTRLLTFMQTTGSAHWLYKEKGYAYAYFGRAEAHAALGQNDLAIADYTQSIRNDPSAAAYNNRGNIHVRTGNLAAAQSDFEEAVRLDPSSEVAKRNLAGLQAARRRAQPTPEATAARDRSRDLVGCLKGGDFDDILAACDRILYGGAELTVSQRAEAFASRGRIQLYRKQYAGAADDLAQAVKLRPDEAIYRKQLDEARAGQGRSAAAVPATATPQRELVRRAQVALARLGYAPGAADGKSGPRTVTAVRAYQRKMGLSDDGMVDAELVAQLETQPR